MQRSIMSPVVVCRMDQNIQMHWTMMETSFGSALCVVSTYGLFALEFVDEQAVKVLLKGYSALLPKGAWHPNARDLPLFNKINTFLLDSTGAATISIPLHLYGTAFQQRVWLELLRADLDRTISYSELAGRVGCGSPRAVGSAVAANRLALLVPCHLVVRSSGECGEYRWGSELKHRILARYINRSSSSLG